MENVNNKDKDNFSMDFTSGTSLFKHNLKNWNFTILIYEN